MTHKQGAIAWACGHPKTPENSMRGPRGIRRCRTCHSEACKLLWEDRKARPRVFDILRIAAQLSPFTVAELRGHDRSRALVRARMAACLVAREHGYSYLAIGRVVGGRDHTTILNAVAKVPVYAKRDADYCAFVDRLRAQAAVTQPFTVPAKLVEAIPQRGKPGKVKAPPPATRADKDERVGNRFIDNIEAGSDGLAAAILEARG